MVTNAQWRELCLAVTQLLEAFLTILSPLLSLVGISPRLSEVCTFFFGAV